MTGARTRVGAAVRLALVVAAGLLLVTYTLSSAAARTPVESARYLSALAISTPAVLWPLWSTARGLLRSTALARGEGGVRRQRWVRATGAGAVAVLVAVLASAGFATWRATGTVPAAREQADRQRHLVAALRHAGVRHLYSDYWTCNNITFATREEIICAVLADDLRPGFDRYTPYRRLVAEATGVAYALPAGSPVDVAFARRAVADPAGFAVLRVDGFHVYLPSDGPGAAPAPRPGS